MLSSYSSVKAFKALNETSVKVLKHSNVVNVKAKPEDVCFFIPNDETKSSLNDSLTAFKTLMSQRLNNDTEFWLFDVSGWSSMDGLKPDILDLAVDLDDNVYFYANDQPLPGVNLWEAYKITGASPLLLNYVTTWRPETSWTWSNMWLRRGNLQGESLRVYSIPVEPYVKKLIKHENGTYTFTGIVADVVWNLQVCYDMFGNFDKICKEGFCVYIFLEPYELHPDLKFSYEKRMGLQVTQWILEWTCDASYAG